MIRKTIKLLSIADSNLINYLTDGLLKHIMGPKATSTPLNQDNRKASRQSVSEKESRKSESRTALAMRIRLCE